MAEPEGAVVASSEFNRAVEQFIVAYDALRSAVGSVSGTAERIRRSAQVGAIGEAALPLLVDMPDFGQSIEPTPRAHMARLNVVPPVPIDLAEGLSESVRPDVSREMPVDVAKDESVATPLESDETREAPRELPTFDLTHGALEVLRVVQRFPGESHPPRFYEGLLESGTHVARRAKMQQFLNAVAADPELAARLQFEGTRVSRRWMYTPPEPEAVDSAESVSRDVETPEEPTSTQSESAEITEAVESAEASEPVYTQLTDWGLTIEHGDEETRLLVNRRIVTGATELAVRAVELLARLPKGAPSQGLRKRLEQTLGREITSGALHHAMEQVQERLRYMGYDNKLVSETERMPNKTRQHRFLLRDGILAAAVVA